MLLLWDCFAVTKPLSQIQKSTLWPLQDANPTPSLGGFGLRLIGRFPPGLAFFDCDGVRLMVSAIPEDSPTGNSTFYFNVSDIQDGYDRLKSSGIQFEGEPHVIHSTNDYELWMAFFKDPDGNTMAIMDERGELAA